MRVWGATYLATGLVLLGLDAVWLSVAASRLYRPKLGPILLDRFNPAPAAAFYLIYIAGILLFAISPALTSGRWTMALARGAMLWLIAYATNDLTNQATLRGWSVAVTVTDRRRRPQALSGGRPCRTGAALAKPLRGRASVLDDMINFAMWAAWR